MFAKKGDWLTPGEAADLIDRFVEGRTGRWEWDDFVGVRYVDPLLEKARLECVLVHDRFPSNDPHRYCSKEGIEVLRGIASQLRQTRA